MKQDVTFSFGEKENDKWFIGEDGSRIQTNEETIHHLWMQWVMCHSAKRNDKDGYAIFDVSINEPLSLI